MQIDSSDPQTRNTLAGSGSTVRDPLTKFEPIESPAMLCWSENAATAKLCVFDCAFAGTAISATIPENCPLA